MSPLMEEGRSDYVLHIFGMFQLDPGDLNPPVRGLTQAPPRVLITGHIFMKILPEMHLSQSKSPLHFGTHRRAQTSAKHQ